MSRQSVARVWPRIIRRHWLLALLVAVLLVGLGWRFLIPPVPTPELADCLTWDPERFVQDAPLLMNWLHRVPT